MITKRFIQIFFHAAEEGFGSELLKKHPFLNSPFILSSYKVVKRFFGFVYSYHLRSLYAKNKLNQQSLNQMTYMDLESVLRWDINLFKKIAGDIYNINVNRMQKKSEIQVAFFCPDSALWSCDELYLLFENDPLYHPFIVVPAFGGRSKSTTSETYLSTLEYFEKRGFRTIGVYDEKKLSNIGWDSVGNPDIVFQLTPYSKIVPPSFNIFNVPLNCLNIYIPYGLSATGNYWVFNTPGAQLSWKYCVENDFIKDVLQEHAELGTWNIVVSGHPKMDPLLKPKSNYDLESIWKCDKTTKATRVKKIIYAPHHSIFNSAIRFSTFHLNLYQILDYAKNHQDTTSWIVKPHPHLRMASVKFGLFKSEEEYDAYMDLWDALPNARTVRFGTYDDIFLTSDAMIMDCGSFLTEYTLTNKPLIFLRRPEQELNEWGKLLSNVLYSVPGNEPEKIFEMLDTVVIQGNDYLKRDRSELFQKYLNLYNTYSDGSSTVCEWIYNYIKSTINGGC